MLLPDLPPLDPGLDHFTRLGLERRFTWSAETIARHHRSRLVEVHPDRFHHLGETRYERAVAHAAAINDAARVLADPLRRLIYLLSDQGPDVAAPAPASPGTAESRVEVAELDLALRELDGLDAHTERGQMGREVARRYAAGLAEAGAAMDALLAHETQAPDEVLEASEPEASSEPDEASEADESAEAISAMPLLSRVDLAERVERLRWLRHLLEHLDAEFPFGAHAP